MSGIVTQAGSDAADRFPAASSAVTLQQCSFPGVSPSSRACATRTDATRTSARNTSYAATPTSSVDGIQESSAALPPRAATFTSRGGVGASVSRVCVHAGAEEGEARPAGPIAWTE